MASTETTCKKPEVAIPILLQCKRFEPWIHRSRNKCHVPTAWCIAASLARAGSACASPAWRAHPCLQMHVSCHSLQIFEALAVPSSAVESVFSWKIKKNMSAVFGNQRLLTKGRKRKGGPPPGRETGELTSRPSFLFLGSFYSQHFLRQPLTAHLTLASSPAALFSLPPRFPRPPK